MTLLDGDIDTCQPSREPGQLVQKFLKRIEIDPNAKRGVIRRPEDIAAAYPRVLVVNAAHGDRADRPIAPGRALTWFRVSSFGFPPVGFRPSALASPFC